MVWATGFRTDWSWVNVAGVTTDGEVAHQRGLTAVPGLYFLGLPWQHSRGSALLGFVKEDAEFVADHLVARVGPLVGSAAGTGRTRRTSVGQRGEV